RHIYTRLPFFKCPALPHTSPLSLHDALPIFDGIESACLFFGVKKIAIPSRLVRVAPLRTRNDRRNAVVRSKGHAFAILICIETECAVLVMRGMEVPAAQTQPNTKLHCRWRCELLRA